MSILIQNKMIKTLFIVGIPGLVLPGLSGLCSLNYDDNHNIIKKDMDKDKDKDKNVTRI